MNNHAPGAVAAAGRSNKFRKGGIHQHFEKQQLLNILDAAWHASWAADWGPHPMFGTLTVKEWGKLLQIHIDYHLRQFAA